MSYADHIQTVPGSTSKKLMLFTLSTCIWCRKTKDLLQDLGIGYEYVDVDLLKDDNQDEAYQKMWEYNHSTSFPTIVINGGEHVITGYDEEGLKGLK